MYGVGIYCIDNNDNRNNMPRNTDALLLQSTIIFCEKKIFRGCLTILFSSNII